MRETGGWIFGISCAAGGLAALCSYVDVQYLRSFDPPEAWRQAQHDNDLALKASVGNGEIGGDDPSLVGKERVVLFEDRNAFWRFVEGEAVYHTATLKRISLFKDAVMQCFCYLPPGFVMMVNLWGDWRDNWDLICFCVIPLTLLMIVIAYGYGRTQLWFGDNDRVEIVVLFDYGLPLFGVVVTAFVISKRLRLHPAFFTTVLILISPYVCLIFLYQFYVLRAYFWGTFATQIFWRCIMHSVFIGEKTAA